MAEKISYLVYELGEANQLVMIGAFSSVLTVVVVLITLGQATAFLPHLISTKQSSKLAMGFFDDLKQKIVAKSAGDYDVPAVSAKVRHRSTRTHLHIMPLTNSSIF